MKTQIKSTVAMALVAGVMGAGCADEGLDSGTTCLYAGSGHSAGESFKSSDGCNTCSCRPDGTVACTLMACMPDAGPSPSDVVVVPDAAPDSSTAPDVTTPDLTMGPDTNPPGTCAYGGKTYEAGESFKSLDGCNTCSCTASGEVACTLMACFLDAAAPPSDAINPPDATGKPDSLEVCLWGDASVPIGQSVFDGCNTCSCGAGGVMMCTERACPPACVLPTGVTFGTNGGMVIYQDENRLDPKTGLTITRTYYARADVDGAAVRSCAPPLPECGSASTVSIANIVADLESSDVQAAFRKGATPLYGVDERPVDGTVYSIALDDVGTILVGYPCRSGSTGTCVEVPAGVQRLADDLRRLAADGLATADCSNL